MTQPFINLPEILDLLGSRSYTAGSLGFVRQPDLVAESFHRARAIVARGSTGQTNPVNFTLSLPTARFNERDRMQLKFNLDYSPLADGFRLRGITAILNPTGVYGKQEAEIKRIFLLGSAQELPDVQLLYGRLTRHRLHQPTAVVRQLSEATPPHRNTSQWNKKVI